MDITDTAQRYDGVNALAAATPAVRARPAQPKQPPATAAKQQGDSVSLSTSAQELAKILGESTGKSASGEQETDPVVRLQKQIKALEDKIAKVQKSAIPDGTKTPVVEGLQRQLAELNHQLAELTSPQAASGQAGIGGQLASAARMSAKA